MSRAQKLLARHASVAHGEAATAPAWDLPTRLFKWTLVALIVLAWVSSGFDDPEMTVHKAAGFSILILLVFRLLWGVVGGSTARFASFVRSPGTVLKHLRDLRAGHAKSYLGHNPVGGWMVVALLFACSVQVALGLVASDGVLAAGPLADRVGDRWASRFGWLHSLWFYGLLGLVLIHVAANLYYEFVKRERLISAMVTGRKDRVAFVEGLHLVRAPALAAITCLAVAAALVYGALVMAGAVPFGAS